MASIFTGGVELATIVDEVVARINSLQFGNEYGDGQRKYLLQLSVLKLRLARWRKTVAVLLNIKRSLLAMKNEELVKPILEGMKDAKLRIQRMKDTFDLFETANNHFKGVPNDPALFEATKYMPEGLSDADNSCLTDLYALEENHNQNALIDSSHISRFYSRNSTDPEDQDSRTRNSGREKWTPQSNAELENLLQNLIPSTNDLEVIIQQAHLLEHLRALTGEDAKTLLAGNKSKRSVNYLISVAARTDWRLALYLKDQNALMKSERSDTVHMWAEMRDISQNRKLASTKTTSEDFPKSTPLTKPKIHIPNHLASLYRVLRSIPSENILFSWHEELSATERIQCFLENVSGSAWSWFPFRAPRRPLPNGCIRVHWQCHCKQLLWQDVSEQEAKDIGSFLKYRGRKPDATDHLCFKSSQAVLDLWFSIILLAVHIMFLFADWIHGRQFWDIKKFIVLFCGMPVIKHLHLMDMWRRSAEESILSAQAMASNVSANSSIVVDFGSPLGDLSSSSAIQRWRTNSSHENRIQKRGSGEVPVGDEVSNRPCVVDVPTERESWVLLGITGYYELFNIGHLDTRPCKVRNDAELFDSLRKKHKQMSKLFKRIFSVWTLNHCELVKFTKPEAFQIFRDSKGPNLPPKVYKDDYDFDSLGSPLTIHEFQTGLNPCPPDCKLSFFHHCIRPRVRKRALSRIPKKKTRWLIQANDKPEEAWGLYGRELPSALRVTVYQLLILLGPFGFWVWWLARKDSRDWQTASVPAAIVLSLQALFWTQLGLLKLISDSVLKS